MAKKLQFSEVSKQLNAFSEASYKKYGSYSYASGYFESSLAQVLADLPAHKQAEVLRCMQQVLDK
jgi:hypothetical protein